jgi:hypothetical protein
METVEGGTRVRVETDMRVTGPAAQFGRGVMQDVSAKLMARFADCLASEMGAAPAPPEPAPAPAAPEPAPAAPPDARVVGPLNPAAEPPPGPAGDSAEAAARPAPAAEAAAPAPESSAPPAARPTPEVLDLGEASRGAVLKRAVPVAGIALLLLLLWRRRR